VSHNADAVRQICDRACLLDNGAVLYIGKSEDALERYRALLNGATPHAIGNGSVEVMSGRGTSE